MKLLLTASGITNKSIADKLFALLGKSAQETNLLFIPTASNGEQADKTWLIDDLIRLKNLHFKSLNIVDISAVLSDIWQEAFAKTDVIYFEGGSPYHLMKELVRTGADEYFWQSF